MIRIFFLLLFAFTFTGCEEVDRLLGQSPKKQKIEYSYACLDSSVSGGNMNRRLEQAGDLIRDLAVSEKSITDTLQTSYGTAFHEDAVKTKMFVINTDLSINRKLNEVLNNLLSVREDPSKIRYIIYALKDTMVNAFTFGGRIYITTAMLKKCDGRDEILYAIIGHEIGHSEVGHIKATIQDMELSNKIFGTENGATFFQLKKLFTASFNQRNELEADYYGINLTNQLGYDVCAAVAFWKQMGSNENRYNRVEDFFRSHPFSEMRATCLSAHILANFDRDCGNIKPKI
jgi:predicted Zn-dependent protease